MRGTVLRFREAARKLLESGGTILDLGSVADGQALQRSGSNLVGAALTALGGFVVDSIQTGGAGTSLSYTVPGGTLAQNGDGLLIAATYDHTSTEQIRLSFGGTSLGTFNFGAATADQILALIYRLSSTSQIAIVHAISAAGGNVGATRTSTAHDLANDQAVLADYATTAGTRIVRELAVNRLRKNA